MIVAEAQNGEVSLAFSADSLGALVVTPTGQAFRVGVNGMEQLTLSQHARLVSSGLFDLFRPDGLSQSNTGGSSQ